MQTFFWVVSLIKLVSIVHQSPSQPFFEEETWVMTQENDYIGD